MRMEWMRMWKVYIQAIYIRNELDAVIEAFVPTTQFHFDTKKVWKWNAISWDDLETVRIF